jgi:hypothetical protein
MITPEERQSIIDEAVEKALLRLPDVIGNLITNQISAVRINRQFYQKFPDFSNAKDVVASVIENLEATNPGVDYATLLEKAAPLIKEQISQIKTLDVKTVGKPNRDLSTLKVQTGNGEL